MKSFSAVVLLAATFFCLDTALAQQVRRTNATATPVGRTATATAAPSVLQDLMDRITALESQASRISTLEAQVAQLQSDLAAETTARMNADVMVATVVMQHMDLLKHFSVDGDDIFITRANLHIVNGTRTTDGATNGLGNLIIGYNEMRTAPIDINDRTGSHMLVVGTGNNYSRFGGIVVGLRNTTSGSYASISGGSTNTAIGNNSSISGGRENTATVFSSSVSGGFLNTAAGLRSSVSGGERNTASGQGSSVSGGARNTASGPGSSVSGGQANTASGAISSVSGGNGNTASGVYSSVSGGFQRMALGTYDWVAGLLFQDM